MMNGRIAATLPQIDRVFRSGTVAGLTDAQLLERFVVGRDDAAFEALVARHGGLVLGVCRRLLRDPNDVDDAFQATLLVLVRQARSVRVSGSLGPWLYGVAHRVAVRAKANADRRSRRECPALELEAEAPATNAEQFELGPLVLEELARLPENLRAPIVLCYLEGLTHDQAAAQLRWPVGTVRSRMARGRDRLRLRLSRRGVTVSAGVLTGVLGSRAGSAAMAGAVARSMNLAAIRAAVGGVVAETVSARAVALMEGVLKPMFRPRLKALFGVVLTAGVFSAGIAYALQPKPSQESEQANSPRKQAAHDSPDIPKRRTSQTFARTYYVGDLVGAAGQHPNPPGQHPNPEVRARPQINMSPVIDLITSTVVPGTWTVHTQDGTDVTSEYSKKGRKVFSDQKSPIGSITPFYLSISLIIRHTPEAHEEVAARLRQLRRLIQPLQAQAASAVANQGEATPTGRIIAGGITYTDEELVPVGGSSQHSPGHRSAKAIQALASNTARPEPDPRRPAMMHSDVAYAEQAVNPSNQPARRRKPMAPAPLTPSDENEARKWLKEMDQRISTLTKERDRLKSELAKIRQQDSADPEK